MIAIIIPLSQNRLIQFKKVSDEANLFFKNYVTAEIIRQW